MANATAAEEAGFSFALISDHFHPWIDRQGESPFVWSVLGGIAGATEKLEVGTGVTCPMIRIHPAIIAQAAATTASLMPGRFFLGLGSGENLNEHILGTAWPEWDVRAEMLEEAVEVIRKLWTRRGHQPPRPPLHGPERADLLAPREAATDLPGGRRKEGRPAGGTDRRRPHRDRAGRRAPEGLRGGGRQRAALRPGDPVLG